MFRDTASASFALPTSTPVLEGYVNQSDDFAVRQLCRDLYYSDVICGSAVDIYSSIPFGDFSLSGLPDRKMLYTFLSSCEKLRLKSLLPSLTVDYLVDGAICGGLNFDTDRGIFDAYIPFNMDNVEFTHLPYYGAQPLIDVSFADSKIKARPNDPRYESFTEAIPNLIKESLRSGGKLQVAPENAVFIPRGSMAHRKEGVSLFRRILLLWLIEKALARGTIEMAHRRQRGITHATVGDGMDWVADKKDLRAVAQAIIDADRDPLGAVIVTRPGVNIQNLGSAQNDLWKHSDIVDQYTTLKMKGMGFSEALYTGELNIGSADSTMSIFNQQMRDFRDRMVRSLLYERVFPFIAVHNRFKKTEGYMETSSSLANAQSEMDRYNGKRIFESAGGNYVGYYDGRTLDYADGGQAPSLHGIDVSSFYMPTLNWHHSLRPEANTEYLELLNQLEAKGVPIMMRTLIAASGMSIGDIMASMDEDLEVRKTLFNYNKQIKKYMPKIDDGGGAGGGGGFDMQSALDTASARRRGVSKRDKYDELTERAAFLANGRRLTTAKGRKVTSERANKVIAAASVNMAGRLNSQQTHVVALRDPRLKNPAIG